MKNLLKIYVDIDETICYYEGERDYSKALPIKKNIERVNKLYDEGHEITYWTARGTVTKINWMKTTLDQLERWGAKYNCVKMGKPAYDLFIDDKAINNFDQLNEYINSVNIKDKRYVVTANNMKNKTKSKNEKYFTTEKGELGLAVPLHTVQNNIISCVDLTAM